ncbi:hypothetical protein BpHYR1_033067 [Brachionus plicatilis]|uniref:Uncharacterized protein n=1 Tax=Brachionus plicatilis TaxID=10195 RepID=A0A3M7RIZ7_BRAPC|nr:hypothetical protein BpHYR1_033067 [Brachionus plicatilis]
MESNFQIYKNKTLIILSLIGSILDYSFPCLNSLSEDNVKKLEVIQNSAVRSILKLKYDTPFNILHHEAYNKLKIPAVSNRLCELSERYIRAGLKGFESGYIEYPTPLFPNSFIILNRLNINYWFDNPHSFSITILIILIQIIS